MRASINTLKEIILQNTNFVLVTHVNPDGDAMGAALGLCNVLKCLGKIAQVISPNEYPDFLKCLHGSQTVLNYKEQTEKSQNAIDLADVVFLMDFNAPKRCDVLEEPIFKSNAKKVMIDHHVQPDMPDALLFSEISSSSTCELTCEILSELGFFDKVDSNSAACFYAGIMTDTGSFSYSISPRTHFVVAALIEKGIDPVKIHQDIYDTYSESRTRLLGYSLSEKLVVKGERAYIWLTMADLQRFNHQNGDTEGVVNYPLGIAGVNVSAIFIEKEDRIKVSLRSKGEYNVNLMARKYFNGGGHKNAAGGHYNGSMQEAINCFEQAEI